ncbi:patatin-like phospholipase family protein [Clostridium rectalis]|uniref:patatin-like phospholipase family protein n=1 Tax=Clostridium rectalis TaxID=2040295 RepID=UPI000F63E7F1|nr:patatin-like phospholipase family protein [Clostridium rectalis]
MKKVADAVFEGGGVKAIGFAGALKVMENHGYNFRNIAGTSAGSIVGALLSVGYCANEIKGMMSSLDYSKMKDRGGLNIPGITPFNNIIFNKGLYKGNYIENWMETMLQKKLKLNRKVKFKDLIIPNEFGILINNKKYKRKYKLHIIATDITREKMIILPEDIKDYGIEPDELEVSLAVRMSISIPYFFQPVMIKSSIDGWKYFMVDGGLLSNYPVWLFDNGIEPTWPTIGFKLVDKEKDNKKNKVTNIINYSKAVVETSLKSAIDMDVININSLRTLEIDTLGVKATEFNISKDKAMELYRCGESCALEFLNGFSSRYTMYLSLRKKYGHKKLV